MNTADLMSEFSVAYVRAVAHAAGFFTQEPNRSLDADGVDLLVFRRGGGGAVRSPRLELQIKATAAPVGTDPFPFDLRAKNHVELCATNLQVPRVLVVVVMPKEPKDWVQMDEAGLLLRRCGYWCSLRGQLPTTNLSEQRVFLSRGQLLDVAGLQELMERVSQGGMP